jgi:Leucine-rich repeat (LRR) protein
MINTGSATTIYTSDLWNIKEFTLPAEAASFTDLAHLTRLETLAMENAPTGVLAQMGTVETLKNLSMPGSSISDADWDVLVSLRSLETLDLSGCSLSTISGLDALSQLKVLNLNHNTVRNLAPLSGIPALQQLDLSHNAVTDLSALSALTNLITLDVSHNSVSTLNPVCSIPTVSVLKASHNQISNIDAMRQLTVLQVLDLSYNTVVFNSDIVTKGYVFNQVVTAAEAKALGTAAAKAALVPEPTTATLSLLALCGLAARRRRK